MNDEHDDDQHEGFMSLETIGPVEELETDHEELIGNIQIGGKPDHLQDAGPALGPMVQVLFQGAESGKQMNIVLYADSALELARLLAEAAEREIEEAG